MQALFPELIIFSLAQGKDTDLEIHKTALDFLNRRGYFAREIDGFYNGQKEKSILVFKEGNVLEHVLTFAKFNNQTSILISDGFRNSELLFLSDLRREYIGKLQEVKSIEGLSAYTEIDGSIIAVFKIGDIVIQNKPGDDGLCRCSFCVKDKGIGIVISVDRNSDWLKLEGIQTGYKVDRTTRSISLYKPKPNSHMPRWF